MQLVEVHTTVGNAEDGERLAAAAVEQHLAACVHLTPLRSVYLWQGRVQHDAEVALAFKTSAASAPRLRAFILSQHPYELPALYTLEVAEASAPYRDWIVAGTQPG